MAEFLDGLGDLCRELGSFEEGGAAVTKELENSINDQINNLQLPKFLGDIQITFTDDKPEMKCGDKVVDRTKLKEAIDKNDVGGIFKELLDENSKVFKSEEYKEYQKNADAQIKDSKVYKENKIQEEIKNKQNEFEKKFGKINTPDDFQNKYNSNPSFKKFVDDIAKKSDEDYIEQKKAGNEAERGSWTKTKAALLITAVGLSLDVLLTILGKHASEMSGCFLKDTSINGTATKCKVQSLTCNADDIKECKDDDDNKCTLCGDSVAGCKDNSAKPVNCFDTSGPTKGTCIKYDEKNKSICSTYLPDCKSAGSVDCNTCNCGVQSCPPGKDLECKQANIGDAFVDYFNQFIDLAESIFKKILYYGAIILIIGFVIFIIVKFLGWLMNRRKSAKVIAITT